MITAAAPMSHPPVASRISPTGIYLQSREFLSCILSVFLHFYFCLVGMFGRRCFDVFKRYARWTFWTLELFQGGPTLTTCACALPKPHCFILLSRHQSNRGFLSRMRRVLLLVRSALGVRFFQQALLCTISVLKNWGEVNHKCLSHKYLHLEG